MAGLPQAWGCAWLTQMWRSKLGQHVKPARCCLFACVCIVFNGSRGVPAVIVRLESTHVSFAEAFSLLSVSPSEVILDVCVHEMKRLWGGNLSEQLLEGPVQPREYI